MMVGLQGTDLLHVPTAPPLLSEQTEVRTRRVTMLAMQAAVLHVLKRRLIQRKLSQAMVLLCVTSSLSLCLSPSHQRVPTGSLRKRHRSSGTAPSAVCAHDGPKDVCLYAAVKNELETGHLRCVMVITREVACICWDRTRGWSSAA